MNHFDHDFLSTACYQLGQGQTLNGQCSSLCCTLLKLRVLPHPAFCFVPDTPPTLSTQCGMPIQAYHIFHGTNDDLLRQKTHRTPFACCLTMDFLSGRSEEAH